MTGTDPREKLTPALSRKRTPKPRPRASLLDRLSGGLFGVLLAIGLVGTGVLGLLAWTTYQRYAADLPTLDGLRTYQPPMVSRVYASDDRLIGELATERRIFVAYSAIPPMVRAAFISAEDQSFYSHNGVDPFAIARAAFNDLQHVADKRRPIGASTITQQVARNMLLGTNAVSFERKVKEALLAMRIEQTLSKPRILEIYLNQIYLGQGAYGVTAAAQAYFNKPLDELTISQAALLAALPKSPSNYNPFRAPDAAHARRDWVIDRMVDTHAITSAQGTAAKAEALVPAAYHRPDLVPGAEWFAGEVKRQLLERFGADQASGGGLIVHTSLDPLLQTEADAALRRGLMHYDRLHGGWRGPTGRLAVAALREDWAVQLAASPRPPGMLATWRLAVVLDVTPRLANVGWLEPGQDAAAPEPRRLPVRFADCGWARAALANGELGAAPRRMGDIVKPGDLVMIEPQVDSALLHQIPKVAGALVSLDPVSGRVLAMSGGWSTELSVFNRATQAARQPGSSFKPFVYLAAMEQNVPPSQRFLDAPFVLGDWRPNDYEMGFSGPTPLHVALENSLNLVTVRLAQKIGMQAVADVAIGLHEVANMPRVLPAALGAVDTTVLREAGAYASLDEGGREVLPSVIDSVQDRDGKVIWPPPGLVLQQGDADQPPQAADVRRAVADPESTFQIVEMLRGVVLNGTGLPVARGMTHVVVGKTGTSQDYNDAWFAGFTPDLVTVVWVGFDTPQTLGDEQTGAAVAGPIWRDFMDQALADRPQLQFRVPDGVTIYRWPAGSHEAVDAFKPGQEPGTSSADEADAASDPLSVDSSAATNPAPPAPPGAPAGTGVDSGIGGLY